MPESVARRELLRGLLAAGRDEEVARAVAQAPSLVPDIFRLLYHPDAVLRHRAAAVLGEAARRHADRARSLLERLAWARNDESGNHCPGAAAAIAEVALGGPAEAEGFVRTLFGEIVVFGESEENVSDLPEVLWAAGRLARAFPEAVGAAQPTLLRLLSHADPVVRALSARALIRLNSPIPPGTLKTLLADTEEVEYVECGYPVRRTIRDLVLHETLAPCCAGGTCRPGQ